MGSTVTFLLSIGLCLDCVVRAQMDTLPRPTLWAIPSPVVRRGADVTLRCQGHLGSDRFQLWKDGELREERNASWQQAEFLFRNVNGWRDARSYSCRSGQGPWWSDLSEALALVVTGAFPTPSISISHSSPTPGTTVDIWCQMSTKESSQNYSFALLEAKSLEPFQQQSPEETQAVFSFPSVRVEDTGSYSCIYYKKTAPHKGSHPSRTLKLTVHGGPLPKPTLWAQPGLVMAPGANITLWCSRPKVSSVEEVTFTLWKAGTREVLQQQSSAGLWTDFSLPPVRPEDTGSYSCTYREQTVSARESEPSEALELVVPGSLPKPSLSALPGLVVEPRMHVTLQCRQAHRSPLWRVTFTLLKLGTPLPVQSQSPAGTLADFPLLSVRAQDAGNYSCVYYTRMVPYQVSQPSEVLELWVTDALPKPSLSAWPGPEVAPGASVTLRCWGPLRGSRFVLYKDGDAKNPPGTDPTQDGALFFLTHVTPKDSGNYSCRYQFNTNGSFWTQHSDPLQLTVRGSEPSNTLLIILSCVSSLLLLLLFCLLLLALLCQGSICGGSLPGENPRRTFLPHQPEAPREEVLYTEVAKERPREPSVPTAEEPQEVTYIQLSIRTLNERKANPKETPTEPTLYATVSWP